MITNHNVVQRKLELRKTTDWTAELNLQTLSQLLRFYNLVVFVGLMKEVTLRNISPLI